MAMSNCLLFYLELRRHRLKRGRLGGIYIRRSHHGWFPHFIHHYKSTRGQHRMVSFVPKVPEEGRLLPPWKFEGG